MRSEGLAVFELERDPPSWTLSGLTTLAFAGRSIVAHVNNGLFSSRKPLVDFLLAYGSNTKEPVLPTLAGTAADKYDEVKSVTPTSRGFISVALNDSSLELSPSTSPRHLLIRFEHFNPAYCCSTLPWDIRENRSFLHVSDTSPSTSTFDLSLPPFDNLSTSMKSDKPSPRPTEPN